MTASKAVCMAVAAVSGVNGVVVVQDFRSSNIRLVTRAHSVELALFFRRASVVCNYFFQMGTKDKGRFVHDLFYL